MSLRVLAFYLITMVFSGGLNSLQSGVGLDPDLIQLVQFAPALAVGVMFLLFRRTTGVQVRFQPAGEVAVRSAVVVAIVAAAMLASVGVNLIAGHDLHGWRSDGLQTRFSVLRSSVIVGLLWGFWHIGGFEHGLVYMGLFVVMAIAMSALLGAVLQAARGANLAVATAFHAAINLGMLLLFNEESGDKFAMGALAGVWVVAAAVTHLVTRRRAVPTAPPEPALTV